MTAKDDRFKVPVIESMQCNFCDGNTAAVPGHEVVDGKVTRCPFINMNLSSDILH